MTALVARSLSVTTSRARRTREDYVLYLRVDKLDFGTSTLEKGKGIWFEPIPPSRIARVYDQGSLSLHILLPGRNDGIIELRYSDIMLLSNLFFDLGGDLEQNVLVGT